MTFRIYLDDAHIAIADFTASICRDNSTDSSNNTYGEGAFGRIGMKFDAGATVNVKLKAYNNTGSSRNVNSEFIYWITPWVPGHGAQAHEPVSLDVPQGSTVYVMLEPLFFDPTKYVRVGAELEREIGMEIVEKRGHKWALTKFAFDVWGDEELQQTVLDEG